MSCSGDNYRELLDGQGTLNLKPYLLSRKYNLAILRNYMYTFKELIDIKYVMVLQKLRYLVLFGIFVPVS